MEEKRKRPASSQRSGSSKRPQSRSGNDRKRQNTRRRPKRRKTSVLQVLADAVMRYQAQKEEFRPDAQENAFKSLHFTRQQRVNLLRWVLLCFTCMMCQVLQDCVFSRMKLFGATTDLGVAAIILVAIMEGSETGGIFALLASVFYHFSGSAPGPYCVALVTVPCILFALFRQKFWRRSTVSNLLCASLTMLVYEVGLFITAMFMGLTHFGRGIYFLETAVYSIVLMIPLYQLIYRIGQMGDHVWKD